MARREHISAKLRHEVFKRDNYRCRECGATNKETSLEIDHIVPVSKGGSNDISNLQTLCKKCNRSKYTSTWVGGVRHDKNRNINSLSAIERDYNSNIAPTRQLYHEVDQYFIKNGKECQKWRCN